MSNPSETLLSPTELQEQLMSGLNELSGAEAHEAFSERLDDFLEQNNIEESEIISGTSAYAPILSEAAFNGLEFSGLEGTGLSLADAHHMMNDEDYRLEMAEKYLTGDEENRIENEYSERDFDPYHPYAPTSGPMAPEGVEAHDQAVKTKEFMHYELRDALNSGTEGSPATFEDFKESEDYYKWQQMLGDQAAFHQNGGAEDLKFIHEDGRELVFDGDTRELMTEDRYMGTYNYVNATIPNDTTPGPLEAYLNTRTEGSLLHRKYDVDTWIELGNTRADRYAHGGAEAREAQFDAAVNEGIGNSFRNTADEIAENVSDTVNQVGEAISNKVGQVDDAINDRLENVARELTDSLEDMSRPPGHSNSIDDIEPYSAPNNRFRDFFGLPPDIGSSFGSWQEGALTPGDQTMDGAHIQRASLSETAVPTSSGTIHLEDAIDMLAADQKTLNVSSTGEASPIQDALNHPDAAQMFQNLHTHGVETLTAEITPDMSTEDRVSELLLAGQEATQQAGIPMPEEQRELEATQELNNTYEDDYSLSL